MARPKKNSPEILLKILDDFWQKEAMGDLSRLKCSELEKYAEKKGINALAYDFRRDREVRKRMEEIKAGCVTRDCAGMPAYKTLDIDALLNNCKTVSELKSCLRELDSYWRKQYEYLAEAGTGKKQHPTDKPDVTDADNSGLELMARASVLAAENRRLKAQNTRMNSMLKKYLYPALAESLLREEGLPVEEKETVDMSKAVEMIEGRKPEPFPGIQEKWMENRTRQEAILEQMRRMAKNGN